MGSRSPRPARNPRSALDYVIILLLAAIVGVIIVLAVSQWRAAIDRRLPPRPPIKKKEPPPDIHYPEVIVSVPWLARRLGDGDVVVADARERPAYLDGHIPGAVSLPHNSLPDLPDLRTVLEEKGLSDRRRIVCYGDSSYSPAAAHLFCLLEAAGTDSAAVLDGGMNAWLAMNRPAEEGEVSLPRGSWEAVPDTSRVASLQYVKDHYGEPHVEIIDARGEVSWKGPATEGHGSRDRTGHIPHSLPFSFRRFLDESGKFRDAPDMWQIFADVGPRPSTPVDLDSEFIVHGAGPSDEGALGYLLLRRAGLKRIRYFPGGWPAWVADSTAPVVRIVEAEELKLRLYMDKRRLKDDRPPEDFILFDVRVPYDYSAGHIPCSVSLPSHQFADSLDTVVQRHWQGIDRARAPIVVYCYGPDCIRSRECATLAARRGFRVVERLIDGIDEWKFIGGKVAREH